MSNKDTVMVAPTRFGKSLVYQIAPLLFDKDNVYSQQQSSHNNNMSSGSGTQDQQEQAYGHTTTEFTDTSTPVRPERVPQQSSVSEETEDMSTMMEAMSVSNSNAAALSLSSVTATSETQQTLSGDNFYLPAIFRWRQFQRNAWTCLDYLSVVYYIQASVCSLNSMSH